MPCNCDRCEHCNITVAQSQKMDILKINGRYCCTHPGNCTQLYIRKHPDAKVIRFGVTAENGIVLRPWSVHSMIEVNTSV